MLSWNCSIAFEKAVEYAGDREQFGKKIQDFQSIQFKLADMATELEASRLMLRDAANKVDENTLIKQKPLQWQSVL
jgi:alkylation response protein AidB-like acyl-CoA dehydrogenase